VFHILLIEILISICGEEFVFLAPALG